ncbi:hypothetical protein Tco_1469236 [Tanacetum coccineum]
MAEELDEQQRQQVMLDAALVPINEQILKQYSFYNALIATKDALEIYMQQYLTGKASAHDRLRFPMLQLLWGMVTNSNIDFAKLI